MLRPTEGYFVQKGELPHAGDYGAAGIRSTIRHLRNAGLSYAGVGNSLEEARRATFVDTANDRVALISVASTFPPHARARRARGGLPGRLTRLKPTASFIATGG
jgi:uncharacterized membrane protein